MTAKNLLKKKVNTHNWHEGKLKTKQYAYKIKKQILNGSITDSLAESTLLKLGAKKTKEAQWELKQL